MKRTFSLIKIVRLLACFLPLLCTGQPGKYFVQFTDKNNSPYSVSNPSAFLSQRAINRRSVQGISIQVNDLPVNPAYVDSVVNKGALVLNRSKWFNGVTIEADTATLHSIQSLPFVSQATQVHRYRSTMQEDHERDKFEITLNRFSSEVAHAQSLNYGSSYNQIHIMNGDYLHDEGFRGENIVIALLDGGFYRVDSLEAFDSIRSNNQILGTWDFVSGDASVYEDNSHGMSVLSTIAGNIPGELVGTAPKADFWLLRTEITGSEYLVEEYNWEAGAEFADSIGADIISSSLGYTTFWDPSEDHTYADMNGHTTPSAIAANIAFSKGMLVLASAGNDGSNFWHYIGSPADGDSVMAVGAVDSSGSYASFSSTGPSSDGDIKPNVAAVGERTIITYSNGNTGPGNGTSFSCPVLAGSAACLWQAHPGYSNKRIFDAIQQSASQHLSPDSLLGYGIPDFRIAHQLLGEEELNPMDHDNFLNAFPNPFSNEINIRFYSATSQEMTVELIDAIGKNVFVKNTIAAGKLLMQSFCL